MWVRSLDVAGVRNLAPAAYAFDSCLNVFLGPNGAGKTSVLEALYLLSRGRSFRGPGVRPLLADGATELQVFGELMQDGQVLGIGVGRGPGGLTMRIDGQTCDSLAELSSRCPMRVVDPSAHELVQGAPTGRRRYMDWGVFHVEPAFLPAWRRYQGALRQRNTALRDPGAEPDTVRAFDPELVAQAAVITRARADYVARLQAALPQLLEVLGWDAGAVAVRLEPGWPVDEPLERVLDAGWRRDRQRGYTVAGPHRADLRLMVADQPAANRLSRGQQKTLALALLLGQAGRLRDDSGTPPILLLDDVVAELDRHRRSGLVRLLEELDGQAFVTAVEPPPEGLVWRGSQRVFHVEQGRVEAVV